MDKDTDRIPGRETDELAIPLFEEELEAGSRAVKTGSVRIDKHVETRTRRLHAELLREDVDIRRVPVNQVVKEIPQVRKQGDTVIVPVVEEELVITKRLILKEEIHLIKRRSKESLVKDIETNREEAEIHRLDAEGRVIPERPSRTARAAGRRSVLE